MILCLKLSVSSWKLVGYFCPLYSTVLVWVCFCPLCWAHFVLETPALKPYNIFLSFVVCFFSSSATLISVTSF